MDPTSQSETSEDPRADGEATPANGASAPRADAVARAPEDDQAPHDDGAPAVDGGMTAEYAALEHDEAPAAEEQGGDGEHENGYHGDAPEQVSRRGRRRRDPRSELGAGSALPIVHSAEYAHALSHPGRSHTIDPWGEPRITVMEALRRSWLLVLLPAIALAAAGVAIAHSRPQSYASEARLSVGRADTTSPAFGGFVTATSQLADVYSRAITSPGVVGPVSSQLHLSANVVRGRLSATPVQDTPIIRVIGTAPSAAAAEQVANSGAGALSASVTDANRNNQDSTRLQGLYHSLTLQKASNDLTINRATKALAADPTSTAARNFLARARAWGETLSLRISAIGSAFTTSEQGQASTQVLFPLSQATSASSNRTSKLQTYGGAGLLAGLVLGVALAMWRGQRLLRRRLSS